MKISDINEATKKSFHGNFGKVVLGMLVYLAFFIVIQVLSQAAVVHPLLNLIIAVCTIVVLVPVGYGLTYMLINVKDGKTISPFDFFTLGFSNFGRAWQMAGGLLLKVLAPMLLMLVSFFMIGFGFGLTVSADYVQSTKQTTTPVYYRTYYAPQVTIHGPIDFDDFDDFDYDDDLDLSLSTLGTDISSGIRHGLAGAGIALIFVGFAGLAACFVWFTIVSLTYALTTIIAIKEEELSCWDALKKSKELMKGNKWTLFVLTLPIGLATGIANAFMSTATHPAYSGIIVALNIFAGIIFYAAAILILAPIFQMQEINMCYMLNNEKNPVKEEKKPAKKIEAKKVTTKKTTVKTTKVPTKKTAKK